MHAAMCDFDAAVASFQEVNINTTSAVGYVSEWQAKRCKIILSPPDVSKCHRVALVSTLPVTPVHIQLDLASPRVAAGLIAWPSGTVHHHILVAAFYGYADSAERTHAAFAELHLALQAYGGHFIIVGDFDVTQEEGPISAALAAGTLRAVDDASQVSLPATSPADIRRIDFALHHPCLFALNVTTERRKPLSDHALVAYDYGQDLYPPMWRAPRFRDLSAFEHLEEEHRTILHQAEPALLHLLQNNQVEEAWVALSNLGEDLLVFRRGAAVEVTCGSLVLILATRGGLPNMDMNPQGFRPCDDSLKGCTSRFVNHGVTSSARPLPVPFMVCGYRFPNSPRWT